MLSLRLIKSMQLTAMRLRPLALEARFANQGRFYSKPKSIDSFDETGKPIKSLRENGTSSQEDTAKTEGHKEKEIKEEEKKDIEEPKKEIKQDKPVQKAWSNPWDPRHQASS